MSFHLLEASSFPPVPDCQSNLSSFILGIPPLHGISNPLPKVCCWKMILTSHNNLAASVNLSYIPCFKEATSFFEEEVNHGQKD